MKPSTYDKLSRIARLTSFAAIGFVGAMVVSIVIGAVAFEVMAATRSGTVPSGATVMPALYALFAITCVALLIWGSLHSLSEWLHDQYIIHSR